MGEPQSETKSIFPAGLLERVRKINNIYKQTVKISPVNIGSVVIKYYCKCQLIQFLI